MIYFIRRQGTEFVKIGYTGGRAKERLKALATSSPEPLVLLCELPGSQERERELHQQFREFHVNREWFRLTDEQVAEVGPPPVTEPPTMREACPSFPWETYKEYWVSVVYHEIGKFRERVTNGTLLFDSSSLNPSMAELAENANKTMVLAGDYQFAEWLYSFHNAAGGHFDEAVKLHHRRLEEWAQTEEERKTIEREKVVLNDFQQRRHSYGANQLHYQMKVGGDPKPYIKHILEKKESA